MSARTAAAVIFDFDLTLADSSKGIIECANYAFERMELPRPPAHEVLRTIGLPLNATFSHLSGGNDTASATRFSELFVEQANRVMADLTVLYPQVEPVLRELRSRGAALAIVSTKFRYRIEEILGRYGMIDAVDLIVGGEDVTHHKPDPEGLLKAIEKLAVSPKRAIYVGDHPLDGIAASNAEIDFIAVMTGFSHESEFSSKVTCFLRDLGGLPDALQERIPMSCVRAK